MSSHEHTHTPFTPQPRHALVDHLREQIERDPEAFLRGRLPRSLDRLDAAVMAEMTAVCADTRDPVVADLGDCCPGCFLEGRAGCVVELEVARGH